MPHSRDGFILKKGDKVSIPCIVTEVQEGLEYCNLSLETEFPMYPSDNKMTLCVNTKQVYKNGPTDS